MTHVQGKLSLNVQALHDCCPPFFIDKIILFTATNVPTMHAKNPMKKTIRARILSYQPTCGHMIRMKKNDGSINANVDILKAPTSAMTSENILPNAIAMALITTINDNRSNPRCTSLWQKSFDC